MKTKMYLAHFMCCCALLLLIPFSEVLAQSRITGKVTDEASGNPIPGATVSIKGTAKGTAADPSGNYSLDAAKGNILVFSFVGYATTEVQVGDNHVINVVMKEKVGSLEEVVVTGYASQRKKDLTGAVSVVNIQQLTTQPTAQISNQLQGRVSGVTVLGSGQPGQEPQVRIRGINSFGNNDPLYVIDGVPTQNILSVNPTDVASMQVLKDAGAASIYGARAANGVIIITTKKGSGRIKVNYDAYYGTQRVRGGNAFDLLDPQEMANLKWMALKNTNPDVVYNDALYGKGATPVLPDYIAPGGLKEGDPLVNPALYKVDPNYTTSQQLDGFYRINKANKQGTDWFHEIFKPAPITSHNISVGGGTDDASYYLSMNYFNQQGTLINTYMKRYTLRANTQFNAGKNIRLGQNMEYSMINNPRIDPLTEGSAIGMAFRQQPIIPVRDIMGNFAGSFSTNEAQLGNARNPVAIMDRTRDNRGVANRLLGNVFAEVDFLKHFTVRSSFGGEIFSGSAHSFTYPEYENAENNKVNSYTESSVYGYNWTWTNTLTYSRVFNSIHNLKVLVGTEAYDNKGRNLTGTTQGYFTFDPNFTNLGSGTGTPTNGSSNYSDGLFSLIGRLDYSLMDKYLLGAVIRRDGSSRFGANNRYGTFPAVSVGWRLSEEAFLKGVSWISDLKLRGGYGIMGNQLNVGANNAFTAFGPDRTSSFYDIRGTSNTLVTGYRQNYIGNPNAKWENNINANIGLDATLFRGHLEIAADYYRKDITDLIYKPEVVATLGRATPPDVNIAQMKNSGLDLLVSANADLSKDLKFTATATLTSYKNEIMKVSDDAPYFEQESRRFNGNNFIRNQVGHSISSFYAYQVIGFWNTPEELAAANKQAQDATKDPAAEYQTQAALGRFRYADLDGDGRITPNDRTFLGSAIPKFSYGLNLEFKYKNFDFSAFFYGVQGNKIWNNVKWWTDFYSAFAGAKSKTALYDSWLPTRHNATAPIQENAGTFSSNSIPNSYFVENGSYLRAKNMVLGYTLPKDVLGRIGIEKFRVYVQASNLFTITKYSGLDPEITNSNATGYSSTAFGVDEGAYPNVRQYLIGVNVSF
jgi:TonB-linked SusC/RagA family outer membrane protein